MANSSDTKQAVTVDNGSGALIPTPKRIDLATLDDVRLELASVYRDMKSGKIDPADGTKLAYVLGQIGKQITDGEQAARLEILEKTLNMRNK
jgi:hypothetical protein